MFEETVVFEKSNSQLPSGKAKPKGHKFHSGLIPALLRAEDKGAGGGPTRDQQRGKAESDLQKKWGIRGKEGRRKATKPQTWTR